MKVNISKEFKWEMSHRLPFHDGPCNNIHGHTYKIRVELFGETDCYGMALDYYHIERIIRPIIDRLDHSFICNKNDVLMLEFLKTNCFKYNILNEYTTAENIAKFFLDELSIKFKEFKNLDILKVRIFETEDVFAELSCNLKE